MDPQQRLLLERGYASFHDAGLSKNKLMGRVIAVNVGQWASEFGSVLMHGPARSSVYASTGFSSTGVHPEDERVRLRCAKAPSISSCSHVNRQTAALACYDNLSMRAAAAAQRRARGEACPRLRPGSGGAVAQAARRSTAGAAVLRHELTQAKAL